MGRTAASMFREALENVGVKYTFGIPGVHNTEIYDELAKSESITPVLVARGRRRLHGRRAQSHRHETRHAGHRPRRGRDACRERHRRGVPRRHPAARDRGRHPPRHGTRVPAARHRSACAAEAHHQGHVAHRAARRRRADDLRSGARGNQRRTRARVRRDAREPAVDARRGGTCRLPRPCTAARCDGRHREGRGANCCARRASPHLRRLGRGGCHARLRALAERLGAPVSTTLQGLSRFPANHPLHAGFGLGRAAVPAVENALPACDCLLAIGTRFGEIATGSYGWGRPPDLIHVDINPTCSTPTIRHRSRSRATPAVLRLLLALGEVPQPRRRAGSWARSRQKAAYLRGWLAHDPKGRVNPARSSRRCAGSSRRRHRRGRRRQPHVPRGRAHADPPPRGFISPTDFNCMGYCVPASIGAKLAWPERTVVGIVGDGAFRMTGLELATAMAQASASCVRVQRRRTRADLAGPGNALQPQDLHRARPLDVEGVAQATGASTCASPRRAVERVIATRSLRRRDHRRCAST